MIRAILIDDEIESTDLLQLKLQKYCADVAVVAVANHPDEGIELIQKHKPDLVFLDIEMPNMNGFTMLEKIKPINFSVIFTTAYSHYAIKAVRIGAIDYLLKPIAIDELTAAIENYKINHQPNLQSSFILQQNKNAVKRISLPVHDGIEFVNVPDIIRCESDGNYTTFYLVNKQKIMVSRNIGEYEELLKTENFFRTHNSHLVALQHVVKFIKGDGGQLQMLDGSVIDVSRRRKDELLELLKK